MKKIALIFLICIIIGLSSIGIIKEHGIGPMKIYPGYGSNETEYGLAYYKGYLTTSDIISFYNKNVKGTKLNYVSLINSEYKGYSFSGKNNLIFYGIFNKNGELSKKIEKGYIENNTIEFSPINS